MGFCPPPHGWRQTWQLKGQSFTFGEVFVLEEYTQDDRIIRVGRYYVYRRYLETTKRHLSLYPLRKARRDILRTRYDDPAAVVAHYDAYRSPQFDGMPGAPEKVGRPTEQQVLAREDCHELLYLEAWCSGVEVVLLNRLDDLQRLIIEEYVMQSPRKRKPLEEVVDGHGIERREAFYCMNEALVQFAFALEGEAKVCTNHALSGETVVV